MNSGEKRMSLSFEERLMHSLREMYEMHGYLPFKMSKFEEYDFYMKNRDFLIGESIISFTDADGTLLALKPDVTLSIVKNASAARGVKNKVYYSENVYRTSTGSHKFKEIMQMGLECIGDTDAYDVCETIGLAAASLERIGGDFVLDISHMGLISELLSAAGIEGEKRAELLSFISSKSSHGVARLLAECDTPADIAEKIIALTSLRVPLSEAREALSCMAVTEAGAAAVEEIANIAELLARSGSCDRMFFDASLMNDMNYYNGIVFRGFISGIAEGVLSGGRYDALMHKMGKDAGAIGFALYLDLLEGYSDVGAEHDVDVLLIYDERIDMGAVAARVNELISDGCSVSAQRAVPDGLRYGRIERMEGRS